MLVCLVLVSFLSIHIMFVNLITKRPLSLSRMGESSERGESAAECTVADGLICCMRGKVLGICLEMLPDSIHSTRAP